MKKNYSYLKLVSFISKLLVLFIIVLSSVNVLSQSTQCKAKLIVDNNRSSKKAGESGVSYKLTLLNTGTKQTTYTISIQNFGTKNKLYARTNNEVQLEGSLYAMHKDKLFNTISSKSSKPSLSSSYSIVLNQGEIFDFFVKLKVPYGTKIGSKNKSKVIVSSNMCTNFLISTILDTLIIDGE